MKLVLIIILSANKIYLFTNSFTLFIGYNFSQIWYIRSFFDDLSFYEVIMKTKIYCDVIMRGSKWGYFFLWLHLIVWYLKSKVFLQRIRICFNIGIMTSSRDVTGVQRSENGIFSGFRVKSWINSQYLWPILLLKWSLCVGLH